MSRVGKAIIKIPAGITVTFENNIVTVTGQGGKLSQEIKEPISVEIAGDTINVKRGNDENQSKALHGLYNRLITNMITGVTKGFTKYLFLNGVGYKATIKGDGITLNLGMSHPIDFKADAGIKIGILTPADIQALGFGKEAATVILKVTGANKEAVGAAASKIRALRPVEPYHLYGIRYSDERVIRKESKSGAKAKK